MKDRMIGFLMGVCVFLLIGAIETPAILETPPEQVIRQLIRLEDFKGGKFQGFSGGSSDALYLINTETGELYKKGLLKKTWERVSPTEDWINE